MQEFAQRLHRLDPQLAATAMVVTRFDVLTAGGATAEALVRAAVQLAGCPAGFETARARIRVDLAGRRFDDVPEVAPGWLVAMIPDVGRAWLERSGPALPNDEMIVERLAIGLRQSLAVHVRRMDPRSAYEVLADPLSSFEERASAARRMRAAPVGRMVARATGTGSSGMIVPTRVGFVEASYWPASSLPTETIGRVGVGVAAAPADLASSWATAVLALRLTTDREHTVVADDYGALLLLLEAADGHDPHPDVVRVADLAAHDVSAIAILEAIARAGSIREAATALGYHHSSIASRLPTLRRQLGYDPRTPSGIARLIVALALHRLATNHFDGSVSMH